MTRTIVGLYDHISQARAAVQDLVNEGFDRDNISLVANASAQEYAKYFDDQGNYRTDVDYDEDELTTSQGAASGATIGATIGGIGGLLMGIGLLAVPGVGPALAAGPIISALVGAGIGATAGGIMGALVNDGIPEEDAGYYSEGVRRGGSLVILTVADEQVNTVETIMGNHSPVDIDERVAQWREQGFEAYDTKSEPYTAEQVAAEQERYTIPVVEENINIGKREVEGGGKRIRSYVREVPVEENITLRNETVSVKHQDVNRTMVDADNAFEEKVIELTETRQEAVVEKEARVVGEVVIEKGVTEHSQTVKDTVRKTEVEVEEVSKNA